MKTVFVYCTRRRKNSGEMVNKYSPWIRIKRSLSFYGRNIGESGLI